MSFLGYNINTTIERSIRDGIRFLFRDSIFPTVGDDGSILWSRPSEYPSLLLGMKRFEPELRVQWKVILRPNEVIFDVGANIGLTVRRFISILDSQCSVWAFEPLPRNIPLLRRNIEPFKEFATIVEAAVGNQETEVRFVDNLHHGALSRLVQVGEEVDNLDKWRETRTISVPQVTLDEFADKNQVVPTFIKLDVEGAAGFVLQGAENTLATAKPAVSCSFHNQAERESVAKIMTENGYRTLMVNQEGKCTWHEIDETSNLCVHPDDPRVNTLEFKIPI